MLVDILRIIFIAGGLVFVFMLVQACWQKKCDGTLEATPFWPVALIGGVANFLDTLGVGSFAVKTACYKQFKLIDDRVLMNVGIGLFAPCMTLVYLLGMNPLAAFPIMMGSTAVFSVFSAGTFIRKGAFDAKAVLAVAIFGPIGVVLAAMLVKSMDMEMLKWLVAFIVIYTSWTMYASWRAARRSPVQLTVESAG
ncbi:sulfite exporter TauE/SafE family protein [Aeromonas fluvialis]|uniref:sulfite exporter TauE/SafE family protein n=1 Tax=Aeromonas fluvialis TaxID=591962 RepID=UPI0005AA2AEB|nr:sulfite exporter TauE/SafE family protein [Aeromonas fluvialis]